MISDEQKGHPWQVCDKLRSNIGVRVSSPTYEYALADRLLACYSQTYHKEQKTLERYPDHSDAGDSCILACVSGTVCTWGALHRTVGQVRQMQKGDGGKTLAFAGWQFPWIFESTEPTLTCLLLHSWQPLRDLVWLRRDGIDYGRAILSFNIGTTHRGPELCVLGSNLRYTATSVTGGSAH